MLLGRLEIFTVMVLLAEHMEIRMNNMFIKKELKDNLCIVTVEREVALNAMNPTVLHELYDNISSLINNKNIGAIIITGSGDKAFIAGADIKLMEKLDKKAERNLEN